MSCQTLALLPGPASAALLASAAWPSTHLAGGGLIFNLRLAARQPYEIRPLTANCRQDVLGHQASESACSGSVDA